MAKLSVTLIEKSNQMPDARKDIVKDFCEHKTTYDAYFTESESEKSFKKCSAVDACFFAGIYTWYRDISRYENKHIISMSA